MRDTALRAGQRIISMYAETAIALLLPELEQGLFDDLWRIRSALITQEHISDYVNVTSMLTCCFLRVLDGLQIQLCAAAWRFVVPYFRRDRKDDHGDGFRGRQLWNSCV